MHILLVEDNPGDARLLQVMLAEAGNMRLRVTHADRLSTGLMRIAEGSIDVALLDLSLPDSQGLDTLVRMHAAAKEVPIVVLTGVEDEALGVQLVQTGAQDYLVKGQVTSALLVRALRYAVERKRAEEHLSLYREIIAKSIDAIAIIDLHGCYLQQNSAHAQLLGFSDEELRGKTPAVHLGEDVYAVISRELARSGHYQGEVMSRTASGAMLYVELSAFVVRNQSGAPYCYVGIKRDITERKRAEAALRELQQRREDLIHSLDAVVWEAEPTQLDVIYISPQIQRLLGYTPEQWLNKQVTWRDVIHPDDCDAVIRTCLENMKLGRNHASEYRMRAANGRLLWVRDIINVVMEGNCPVAVRGVIVDITERKHVEKQLQNTLDRVRTLSKRVEAVREEERARVARELHDELGVGLTCLKIDLSRLLGMAGEAANVNGRREADKRIRSMVEFIDTTIAAVQRIVAELRPAVLDDLGLVAAIEWQAQDFQQRTGIACTSTANREDMQVHPERATALFRICQEALTNVARHARATEVAIHLEEQAGSLVLAVRDNGQGISEEKITDPQSFGLMGMRERAGLFGGDIDIEGVSGKGTTIRVHLPPQ